MKSKNIIIAHRRRTALLIFIIILSCFISLLFMSFKSDASSSVNYEKVYMSYEVQAGDSLWSIAAKFAPSEYVSTNDYIEDIKRTNHILNEEIFSGQILILSYYEETEEY